jgi:hypothetical protein
METTKEQSKRAGMNAPIAAIMGVIIGLVAGVSLSHNNVSADPSSKASPAAIAASSSPAGAQAVAADDRCDIQLD